jgi:hypothetical protein
MRPLVGRSRHVTRTRLLAFVIVGVIAVAAVAVVFAADRSGPPIQRPSGEYVPSMRGSSAVLWAVGDADGSANAKAVAGRIARSRFDRLLYVGDVYESGTAEEFRTNYDAIYGRFARKTAPTPGNHEWGNRGTGYEPYWRRKRGMPPAYYTFRAGGWRILSLNSEAPHGTDSAQVRWLKRQVRDRGTCRLAFWHRPRFSAGQHGDQSDTATLWNPLRGKATLVLGGHDHDMQRFAPVDGLTQFVTGAGGRHHYALGNDTEGHLAFGDDEVYGALRIALRPGRANLSFVAADGRVLDRHTVTCRH